MNHPLNLTGKHALVTGVADNVGFGFHIAKSLAAMGASVHVSCHPRVLSILERYLTRDKYAESRQLPFGAGEFKPASVIPCDVEFDAKADVPESLQDKKGYEEADVSVAGLAETLRKAGHPVDFLIHSVAFSPEVHNSHVETSREAYLKALSVSSYSLLSLTKALLPLMEGREGSIVALSYLASERAVPFYGGGMASAKAALECDARMLAHYVGQQGHRVNIISAGPYASRAAKAIGDIGAMIDNIAGRSAIPKPITPEDVAKTALYLCSTLASGVTGEIVHVDNGFHAMAI